nr:Chain C, GP41 PEPTIDE [Human immunodeficiency virus 1]
ELDKHAS